MQHGWIRQQDSSRSETGFYGSIERSLPLDQPRTAGVHKSETRKCKTPVQNQTAVPLTPFAPQSMSWAIT
ncbi:hypothetical protein M407DRAFT_246570, partial [Tulasnella calospora MUT 4182]